jgi:hypothetical protein
MGYDLFRYTHNMVKYAALITQYMNRTSQFTLFGKIRRALVFSVLSIIMSRLHGVYKAVDILSIAFTVNFICTVLHTVVLSDSCTRRRMHCGYILRSISRQSVLVISSTIANSIHLRDIGTQQENTLLLIISTTACIALITMIPTWFIKDAQQGSLKDLLIYSFTSHYKQLHIPGLQGQTGAGTLVYGLIFALFTVLDKYYSRKHLSDFLKTLHSTATMVFVNLFVARITPASSSQVLPVAILLGMYIVSDKLPMSGTVAAFVLWCTASEVSTWTGNLLSSNPTDQLIFFSLSLCILPVLNDKIASVFAISALQTLVGRIMDTLTYLTPISSMMASMCMLLVTDIVLDAPS